MRDLPVTHRTALASLRFVSSEPVHHHRWPSPLHAEIGHRDPPGASNRDGRASLQRPGAPPAPARPAGVRPRRPHLDGELDRGGRPRGIGFTFDRHRVNVATSPPQCRVVLVCAPRLLDADCKTVEQMRLVNAVCRFVELAAVTRA
jgi:hypothetical protein